MHTSLVPPSPAAFLLYAAITAGILLSFIHLVRSLERRCLRGVIVGAFFLGLFVTVLLLHWPYS